MKYLNDSPPDTPPHESAFKESLSRDETEKIYLDLLKTERKLLKDEMSPFVVGKKVKPSKIKGGHIDEARNERVPRYIFFEHDIKSKSYDMGLPSLNDEQLIKEHTINGLGFNVDYGRPKTRGSYKKTAVHTRIQEFIHRCVSKDVFSYLKPIHKKRLVFYMKQLGLARDKLTIQQYLERFLLYRYFSVDPRKGLFYLDSVTPVEKPMAHNDMMKLMMIIRGVSVKKRKTTKGCY